MQATHATQSHSTCTRRQALALLAAVPVTFCVPALANVQVADQDAGQRVITKPSGLRYYDFNVGRGNAEVRAGSGQRVVFDYTMGTTGGKTPPSNSCPDRVLARV
jgi:hypothetical protein